MKRFMYCLAVVLVWLLVSVGTGHSQSSTGCDDGHPTKYGQRIGAMFSTIAKSNGACAGSGIRGNWQCVEFVERYYGHANDWNGDANAWFNQNEADERNLERRFNGGAFSPVPGNVICFSGGTYGHVGIVKSINFVTNTVTVVDQNRSRSQGEHTHALTISGSGQNRTYSVTGFGDDPDTKDVVEGYTVQGWLAVKIGSYHKDLVSGGAQEQAYIDAYNRHGSKLGWAFDWEDKGPWVTNWNGVQAQFFLQPDLQKDHYGIDGETAIILSPSPPPFANNAYLLKEGFWCWYKEHNGPLNMGAPTSEEFPHGNGKKQTFQKGYLIWDGQQGTCDDVIIGYTLNGVPLFKHFITVNSSPSGATVWNEGTVRIASFQDSLYQGFTYNMHAGLSGYDNTDFKFAVGNSDATFGVTLPVDTQTGLLNLVTDPSGAQIYRDGSPWPAAGTLTPLMGQTLAIGNYTFTAQKSGYETTTIGCVIENDVTTETQVRLNPASFPQTIEAESMGGVGIPVSGGKRLTTLNNWFLLQDVGFPEKGVVEIEVVAKAENQVSGQWPRMVMPGNAAQEISSTSFASYFFTRNLTYVGTHTLEFQLDGQTRTVPGHSVVMDKCIIRYIPVPPPAAPSNLVAVCNHLTATLTWADNASNEEGFKVERQIGGSGNWSQLGGILPANTTTAQFTMEVTNELFRFRVRSTIASGAINSAYSNESLSKTLGTPNNLSASAISSSKIKLLWMDNSSLEDGFKIERKPSNGSYSEIASIGSNVVSFVDSAGLSPSTTYVYRVRAFAISDGSFPHVSNYSGETNATTLSNDYTDGPGNLFVNGTANDSTALDQWTAGKWYGNPRTGNNLVRFTTNALYGPRSLEIVKGSAQGSADATRLTQPVNLTGGTEYRLVALIDNSSNISGTVSITNYQNGGSWAWQNLWWEQSLSPGKKRIVVDFIPSSTYQTVIQFQWGLVSGSTRLDSLILRQKVETTLGPNLLTNGDCENTNDDLNQNVVGTWYGEQTSGSNLVRYTTNAIQGSSSLEIVKASSQSESDDTRLIQAVSLQAGKKYRLSFIMDNASGISGTATITNYQWGGSWSWQNLWWQQNLSSGRRVISLDFTPNVTGDVAIQFQWGLVVGSTRLDSISVKEIVLAKSAGTSESDKTLSIPTTFYLYQNHPNPFNPITTIRFDIPVRTNATLTVYNLVGQKVTVLVDGLVEPGSHKITWDAHALPSGVYLYELTAGGFADRKKLSLIK